jgi:hypothetical protein
MRAKSVPVAIWLVILLCAGGGQVFAKPCPTALGYTAHGKADFSGSGPEGLYIEQDGMRIELAANRWYVWPSNAKFNNAWICVSFLFPKATTTRVALGLAYWFLDTRNFRALVVGPTGGVAIYRIVNGELKITPATDIADVPDPHSNDKGNSLEAVFTGDRLQIFLNDVRVGTIEETPPQEPWRAGLFAFASGNEGYKAIFPSVEILELK